MPSRSTRVSCYRISRMVPCLSGAVVWSRWYPMAAVLATGNNPTEFDVLAIKVGAV
jgi:hypothetical protein